jgi:hypothetical protein
LSTNYRLGVRWTVGDASPRGFEALRLSLWGAFRLFGTSAEYVVCVNRIGTAEARARTGDVPVEVEWRPPGEIPRVLTPFLGDGMADGAAWKFAPLRLFPEQHELALDNDCILWAIPRAIGAWLGFGPDGPCVIAEDVRLGFGQFASLCGAAPRNSGIRGLPPGFDLGAALQSVLAQQPAPLASELDEQGLQVAATARRCAPLVVRLDEVSICSPFHPHIAELGTCGAHFVGLNMRHIPWRYYDRPADQWAVEHWARHRPALYRAVGLSLPAQG